MNNKALTPITDKNGKRTSVWRNVFALSTKRPIPLAAPTGIALSKIATHDSLLMPRNPHVRVVPMDDGSKSLYVETRSVEKAIAHDANNDMSYKLPVSMLMDTHGIDGEVREEYDGWMNVGDLGEAQFALLEAMGDLSMEEFIAPVMDDETTQSEIRRRFFDPRSQGEKAVLNPDGSIAGYLYPFRDARDITLEDIRPDLSITYPTGDIDGHNEFEQTEKYLSDYQGYEDGIESGLRDDYFDDIIEHVRLYGHPKSGITRMTFITEHTVIKFPLNMAGVIANANENRQANHGELEEFVGVPVAENELKHTATGMPYLVMERVDTDVSSVDKPLPRWTDLIDGVQVGVKSNGELVAYDL